MATLLEFMAETKSVNRWLIAVAFIMGMLMGAIVAVLFMWSALLV